MHAVVRCGPRQVRLLTVINMSDRYCRCPITVVNDLFTPVSRQPRVRWILFPDTVADVYTTIPTISRSVTYTTYS